MEDHEAELMPAASALNSVGDQAAGVGEVAWFKRDACNGMVAYPSRPVGDEHVMADFLGTAGDVTAAVTELREVLLDFERVLGPEHLDTRDTRERLERWEGELAQIQEMAPD